ncbi:RadC family protein [Acetobacter oeni]|uniref:RadC family protein n=1 Tax=Acetobacter oeni TaxID=304077 RepID=UPI00183146F2|nr:DNA repair protein RadC [Acetobacter oeni]MBB3881463.1 DNA repair protein RadC [Acetobacter oeni]
MKGLSDSGLPSNLLYAQIAASGYSRKTEPNSGHSAIAIKKSDILSDDYSITSDLDIVTALIRLAMPKHEDPGQLSQSLLLHFGSLSGVLTATNQSLRAIAGVGPHLLSAIRIMQDAALRLHRASLQSIEILSDRPRLYQYLSAVLAREVIEQFRILFLRSDDTLIADEAQARGTVNHTPVYPREVVRRALELGATSIILVHNHPSGDPTPSPDDLAMTRQVSAAAAILGLVVRDHIIVGNGRWLSFAEKGLL